MPTLADSLLLDPKSYIEANYDAGYRLTREQLEAVHLTGARQRFEMLRDRIPVLRKLAEEQGVTAIHSLDDVVPLLFPHTVYKSYPFSIIERGHFERLTRWLNGLTACDLSGVDHGDIDSIDSWIKRLDDSTELRLLHTFGTSGKLSFVPRTARQWVEANRLTAHCVRDWHGPGSGPDLFSARMPMVQPGYRFGAGATYRGVEQMVTQWAGGDANALFLYPNEYFSADIASLAGRLRAAESRGEQGQLELSASLLARREEFAAREQQRPERMKQFLEAALQRFGGSDICLFAVWPLLFEWAEQALAKGVRRAFGPGSILMSGGGSKGRVLPDDYREQIFSFLGFERVFEFYSMSELMVSCPRCEHGHYHIPPVLVPFVLDPDTGRALPREGTQTGRFAYLDLLPDSYWGGLVSGDEVTISGWDTPCECGRHGPYLSGTVRRYSEKQGGVDKINCAGAPEAHDRAVEFLLSSTQNG
ncbi:hypothetical protein PTE30175_03173 [Pandoraea terrae]|uniref:Acyl-protein synthetase LuxE domain-containing protein n=1 Tax=Pandoraea terrae TaxID=1537710 RepID=A0A5E4WK50_9BURK|nr:hypothetical protein [Pandoraea terrae]VVE23375.1 hypothetical protein PTE30175_03173 [Pandoraea terrae]